MGTPGATTKLDLNLGQTQTPLLPLDRALSAIRTLVDCDAMEDIATLPRFPELLADSAEIADKLCNIGKYISIP